MIQYVVLYEQGAHNWSAYAPDVPGCVAAGATREETEARFKEALALHLAGMREDGEPIPLPTLTAGTVEIDAA